jgi:6-phosphogluconolactonase
MSASRGPYRLFIGTYTKGESRGIYSVTLDGVSGVLGTPELAAEAPNPTFLAVSPDHQFLYAVCAGPSWASSFRIDPSSSRLIPIDQIPAGSGPTPCHIAVDSGGTIALAANYHLGQGAAIPLHPDGTLGEPRVVTHSGRGPHPTRQTSPHVHSTNYSPDERFALVCDLGLDRVYTYAIDRSEVALKPAQPAFLATAPEAGPRHLAFDPSGRFAYVINELGNTVVAYSYEARTGALAERQTTSVLPQGFSGEAAAAEVALHPGGRFLYASCRGSDTLALYSTDAANGALARIEVVPCGGRGPRHFSLSPDGRWLVCAHQDSNTLCAFSVDGQSGRLRLMSGTVAVPMPVCAVFAA